MSAAPNDEWVFMLRDMTTDQRRHAWAFYYFCKRKGDECYVDNQRGVVTIRRRTNDE